jgi:hypothetical protein
MTHGERPFKEKLALHTCADFHIFALQKHLLPATKRHPELGSWQTRPLQTVSGESS